MWIRNNIRELALLALIAGAFALVNPGMQWLFPEAGVMDWSFLTVCLAGLFKAVLVGAFSWVMLSVFCPTFSGYIDSGNFSQDFWHLPAAARLRGAAVAVLTILFLVLSCVIFC